MPLIHFQLRKMDFPDLVIFLTRSLVRSTRRTTVWDNLAKKSDWSQRETKLTELKGGCEEDQFDAV